MATQAHRRALFFRHLRHLTRHGTQGTNWLAWVALAKRGVTVLRRPTTRNVFCHFNGLGVGQHIVHHWGALIRLNGRLNVHLFRLSFSYQKI